MGKQCSLAMQGIINFLIKRCYFYLVNMKLDLEEACKFILCNKCIYVYAFKFPIHKYIKLFLNKVLYCLA